MGRPCEAGAAVPVAVARYRTGARTLTAKELAAVLRVTEARFCNNDAAAGQPGRPTTPAVAIPLVLQRFVAPGAGGMRWGPAVVACPPRHPMHFEPSVLESNGIL